MENKCDICKRPVSGNLAFKLLNVWGNHVCADCMKRYRKEAEAQNIDTIEMYKRITHRARNHVKKGSFATYNPQSPNPFIIGYGEAIIAFETMDDVATMRDLLNKMVKEGKI